MTQLITNRIGRQYVLNDNDLHMVKHLGRENGPYQVRNLRYLRTLLPRARTIIDVGANLGMNTIEYATWCERVEAFEPSPETFDRLLKTIEINRGQKLKGRYYCSRTQTAGHWPDIKDGWFQINKQPREFASLDITGDIHCHQVALGAYPGTVGLKHNNQGLADYVTDRNPDLQVPQRTIDSYQFESVDAIKIDTEGTEWCIVQGATVTIETQRPVVQVEMYGWERRLGIDNQEMLDYFQDLDYVVTDYGGRELDWTTHKIPGVMDRFFVPGEKVNRGTDST